MQRLADLYIIYQLVKRMTTPFMRTPAFARGIIDKHGNVLRPMKTLKTKQDKDAWTWLDVLLNNLKRILVRLPGSQTQFFTYAAALFLLREPISKLKEAVALKSPQLTEAILGPEADPHLNEAIDLCEEAPAVAAGHGQIAGVGVGAAGEPGITPPSEFAGCRVFGVDSTTFQKCRFGKRKYARYEQYVGAGPMGEEIRTYGKQHRKKGIILMDMTTGSMFYLRRPRV